MKILTDNLKIDLKSYGLNPEHWTALLQRNNRVILRHRKDREFTMVGTIRNDPHLGEQWRSLQVRTI